MKGKRCIDEKTCKGGFVIIECYFDGRYTTDGKRLRNGEAAEKHPTVKSPEENQQTRRVRMRKRPTVQRESQMIWSS